MREIKFRAWNDETKGMIPDVQNEILISAISSIPGLYLMQYTGLKDKGGVAEVYEGDILDEYGNIKGNIYQMDKGKTDTVIQGFGTKTWCSTHRRAILLGCTDAE